MSQEQIIVLSIYYIFGAIAVSKESYKLYQICTEMFGKQNVTIYQKIIIPLTSWLGWLVIIVLESMWFNILNKQKNDNNN
jgi:hypothetical protein